MRILILATELSPMTGGIQRYTHALAVAAAKAVGPANVLVLPFNGSYPAAQTEYLLNDKLARLQRLWGVVPRRWVHALHVRRLIAEFQPDLIICNHVELAAHGRRAKQQSGTPYWVVAYGIEVWGDIPPDQADALGKSDCVVAISKVTQEILALKGILPRKIELLFYGFDTNLFSPKAESASAAPVLLTVCRLDAAERYKGYDRVVELMPDLLKEFPALRYRIVGDGTDRARVEELARTLGVQARVEITGFVREVDKFVDEYRRSNIFVMPSVFEGGSKPRGEGFGIVYLEAAACGKPVIAAKGGGAAEAVADGETGLLIDAAKRDELRGAIERLLRSPEEAQRMGAAGRLRVTKLFSKERFEERFSELLRK
ncbi:MAG: glycosyltransferase family 4 protein [Chloroflexi bacterium]|nr:glycosyltransferase family 4 protein [Chloroflexota bacterium]